ncbi:MAG: redox-regulated ATPase YchF [Saccharofermentanales bacterium]|jgi:GTP-binding protein YchF|nr:redox-regulated ATPase YchF [Bacillota bacterium]
MKLGIVGLPNVGKSTLFKAITGTQAEIANYPFCTINPNISIVPVPDRRLDHLCQLYQPERCIPAVLEVVDIAGLVRGASKGEGLGNQFLSSIREVDAIIHVIRCFDGTNITHVDGSIDPVRDIETIELELILSDIEYVEKRINKYSRLAKSDKIFKEQLEILNNLLRHLEEGKSANCFPDLFLLTDLHLLTGKPVLYVANTDEQKLGGDYRELDALRNKIAEKQAELIIVSAEIEAEIADLPKEERQLFSAELGLSITGQKQIIQAGYKLLDLLSFFTAGGSKEVRAWTISKGTKAPQAAGKIHSDFERGFIRAEVTAFEDLLQYGTINAVKEKGKYRSEGKDYVVQDGDIILFRFNV